ncbi:MAG: hypothetical protein O2805_12700, partial [Proteobacteria bacterium]|nr:hypothetical protein [Pseudomonadota bacterium]
GTSARFTPRSEQTTPVVAAAAAVDLQPVEGVLRAEGDLEAAVESVTGQSRASNLRSGKKCQNIRQTIDTGWGVMLG